ncbi:MAG: hypothetical protein AB8H79_25970 [Myxococcota bacterium]
MMFCGPPRTIGLVALASCVSGTAPDPEPAVLPTPTIVTALASQSVSLEVLGSASFARAVDGTRRLVLDENALWLVDDASVADPIALGAGGAADGAVLDGGQTLLALDGSLYVVREGVAVESPLNDVIPMPVESVSTTPFGLWLAGAGRVVGVRDGRATEVQIGDRPLVGAAAGPDGSLWLALPDIVGIDALQEGFPSIDGLAGIPVRQLVVSRDSTLLAIDDQDDLRLRNGLGQWAWLDVGSAALELAGSPWSDTTWVRTEAGALVYKGGEFLAVDVPDGAWQDVDESGRLLLVVDGELTRVGLGRPVAFSGLRPGANVPVRTEIDVVPTLPQAEERWTAWVDDQPVLISANPFGVVLDPDQVLPGEHQLRIVRSGPDGTHTSTLPFSTGTLPDGSWDEDIEQIAQDNCFACHAETTSPVLGDADQWRMHIDAIIRRTSEGTMPPGEDELTTEEIARIRGWRQGGFR